MPGRPPGLEIAARSAAVSRKLAAPAPSSRTTFRASNFDTVAYCETSGRV